MNVDSRNMNWRNLERRHHRNRRCLNTASTSLAPPMISASSLHFPLLLSLFPLLSLFLLLKISLSLSPFPLLLALQGLPLLRKGFALHLKSLSVDIRSNAICVRGFQFSFQLLDIGLAAHFKRIGCPLLQTSNVNGELLVLEIVVVRERTNGI